jgi:hypothetical protein
MADLIEICVPSAAIVDISHETTIRLSLEQAWEVYWALNAALIPTARHDTPQPSD